ncbi:MAG: preprotein translocase [Candidatus Blackburnbacteria bacterium RIFCSPLOWO2_01_FULL_41_27]|uniref:Sec-independent protein translocase protein TatA n=2 Tax=Candidatus Blackburniibacteriota TaxID=1817898 RepID=A0A1G1V5S5_9BACT|nr:MAG: preprotein translocase [Candidatus Blackburnbacteria bacterium RIFCSPHIGHO2_12_FULL_41_13b]OGY14347.1 MAG: preprotein translocase [Candidatus Blackburnbacteria bacterium RIFCSPLOWO2_01_FULL_41_27]
MFNLGSTELIVIALVLLVLFGGKKLPELARGVGDSIKEFKKAAKD